MRRRLGAPTAGKNRLNRSFININSLFARVFALGSKRLLLVPEIKIFFRANASIQRKDFKGIGGSAGANAIANGKDKLVIAFQ